MTIRVSEMLISIASWLESPDNEALLLSDDNDECLAVVTAYCVEAADILKQAAVEADKLEPKKESLLNNEGIDSLASLAEALDSSGDINLMKQASLLDELLVTISSPEGAVSEKLANDDKKIKEMADKFQNVGNDLLDVNKIADVADEIKDVTKNYKTLEAPLNSRYCPDHPGVNVIRVEDGVWQCELDKKQYDYRSGFDLIDGSTVSGGDVTNQTDYYRSNEFSQFDSREGRLNSNK